VSLAAAVLAACAHAPGAPAAEGDAAEIMRLDAAGAAAALRRDAAATQANYGDDIVYCGSRGVALGEDGIAAAWKSWFSAGGPLVTWTPDRAGAAASGDLGWSAGRSRAEIKDAQGRPALLTGEYVTVWSKGPGGWKGVMDLAGSRPAGELGPGERREVRALRSAAGDVEAAMGLWQRTAGEGPRAGAYLTLRKRDAAGAWQVVEDRVSPFAGEAPAGEAILLDAAWAWAMARGDAEGWRALVAGDALFAGRMLLRGRDEVWTGWKAFFAEGGPSIRWTPLAGAVAGSGDLAWTTGRSRLERRGPDGKPVVSDLRYLTVWARDAGGAWRVALDSGLQPAEALGPLERAIVRSLASKDGTLEAAMGTWRESGPSGRRSGSWITVREKAGVEWKTLFDGALEFPPSR
jgi:ketosteroid isomerase-like protein